MIGDVKMQTIKRRIGRSLTGDRLLFLALTGYVLKHSPTHIAGFSLLSTHLYCDFFHFILEQT